MTAKQINAKNAKKGRTQRSFLGAFATFALICELCVERVIALSFMS